MIGIIIEITLWVIWMFLTMSDIRSTKKRLDRLEWDVEIDKLNTKKVRDKESIP